MPVETDLNPNSSSKRSRKQPPMPSKKEAKSEMPDCLFCGSSDYEPLYENIEDRLGVVPGKWAYKSCKNCHSAILHPFPKAEEIPAYYPEIYTFAPEVAGQGMLKRKWADLENKLFYVPQNRAQANLVLKKIGWKGQKNLRLLDVGCGRGLRLLTFREKGFLPEGFDFQQTAVEYVKNTLGIPASFGELQDISKLFPNNTYDVVTAFYVLEHLIDIKTTLTDLFALLKPGGWLVAAVPLIDSLQSQMLGDKWAQVIEAPRHITGPSQQGIELLYKEVGFEKVQLVADTTLSCASSIGLSLIPASTTTHLYHEKKRGAFARRLLGGALTVSSLPFCAFESHVLKRPALGIIFARKPE